MSAGTGVSVVEVGGRALTVDDYLAVAEEKARARLAAAARSRMEQYRASLERQLAAGTRMYGVNTGYGADSVRTLAPEVIRTVQRNTVVSHAVGVGPAVPREIVRGMMLLKASVLAQGPSAVRPVVAELILDLLNHDIVPVVPEQGSLAASGDLVPSGHLALALLGEGEVLQAGRSRPAREVLAELRLQPLEPEAKEGLALVNGTVFSEAYALEAMVRAHRLLQTADVAGAATLQALKGHLGAFQERTLSVRSAAVARLAN